MFHVHKNMKLVFIETPSLTFTLYMLQTLWLQIILKQYGMNGYFICVLDPFLFIHQQCTCLQLNNGPELWWLWDSSFYQLWPQGLADSFLIASVSEEDSILFSHKLFPPLEGTTVFTGSLPKMRTFGEFWSKTRQPKEKMDIINWDKRKIQTCFSYYNWDTLENENKNNKTNKKNPRWTQSEVNSIWLSIWTKHQNTAMNMYSL